MTTANKGGPNGLRASATIDGRRIRGTIRNAREFSEWAKLETNDGDIYLIRLDELTTEQETENEQNN